MGCSKLIDADSLSLDADPADIERISKAREYLNLITLGNGLNLSESPILEDFKDF